MESFPDDILPNLTKAEILGLLEILHYSGAAQSQKEFELILQLVRNTFSFPYVLGGVVLSTDLDADVEGWNDSPPGHRLLNVSYPEAWLKEYFERKYYVCDPVLDALGMPNGVTQTWAELVAVSTPAQREIFDRAATYGMSYGISATQLDAESKWGSFISCAGPIKGEDERLKPVIGYIIKRIHDSMVVWNLLLRHDGGDKYSERDREVIRWMGAGKTNGEIGKIIGLTERTVKYYVARLFMKLDVSNRTQLVSEARKLGLLQSA